MSKAANKPRPVTVDSIMLNLPDGDMEFYHRDDVDAYISALDQRIKES